MPGLTGFIPLTGEDAFPSSTRGQRLSSLIQSRSSTNLYTLHKSTRPLSFREPNDEENGSIEPPAPQRRSSFIEIDHRRMSLAPEILQTPQMRSMRLIGNSNPRYHWHKYYKTEEELKQMKKPIRQYYERNNYLIGQYMYIDRLLDSSLPHDLLQDYGRSQANQEHMKTITEESSPAPTPTISEPDPNTYLSTSNPNSTLKRTPKNLYKVPDETDALLTNDNESLDSDHPEVPAYNPDDEEESDSSSPAVTIAIYINLTANILLLISKIIVIVLTSSLSVLASLVDAALDFLSTAIVWTTTKLIASRDQYAYPVGRRRLEPVGVLVFSVIMMTSFFQVALTCFQRLIGPDRDVVALTLPAIIIMLSTILIKGFCWFWCRLVRNSSVQALAQDAVTDVIFNTFSIIFPLAGYYFNLWWADALGGLLLSFYVILSWSRTSSTHIRHLSGAAASADQRNVLLYLTMRFAKTIRSIQGIQAYHAGDKLNVEVDIVLDEKMTLRDTHDLSESLQYVLESVPSVDRAFVHADYAGWNLPSHLDQQA